MSSTINNYTTTGSQSGCGTQSCCAPQQENCRELTAAEQENLCGCEDAEETCACRDSIAAALQLLCSGDLPALVDFNRFAFLTDNFQIGAYLVCPCGQTGTYDNLSDTLTGSFNRFTPCSCELIDVSGTVYGPTPYQSPQTLAAAFTAIGENLDGVDDVQGVINAVNALAQRIDPDNENYRPALLNAFLPLLGACSCPNLSVSEVSLCALRAIAFEPSGTTAEQQAYNYQAAKQSLLQILRPKCPPPCKPCRPPQPKPCRVPPCCENKGILSSMDRCGMAHTVSLTAGNLLLVGATLLGSIGNALILSSDADSRFYIVCTEQVEFIG